MLELRPSCEHCNTPLAPDSTEAMICSFECTFCCTCVDGVLNNVCPNCGGGFVPRPVRPANIDVKGNNLHTYPAGDRVVHKPVDLERQKELVDQFGDIPPEQR